MSELVVRGRRCVGWKAQDGFMLDMEERVCWIWMLTACSLLSMHYAGTGFSMLPRSPIAVISMEAKSTS